MTGGGDRPVVVILNGVGSVGKTSTARALQAMARRPLLHVAMDTFLDMLPARLMDHPDGLTFAPVGSGGPPCLAVQAGPVLDRAMAGMRHAVAAMAAQGNDLVVDEVLLGRTGAAEYRALLAPFTTRFVGLFAPLDVLEQRERARGDRALGLARWQFDRVHDGVVYDLELDTGALAPDECALAIRDAFGL